MNAYVTFTLFSLLYISFTGASSLPRGLEEERSYGSNNNWNYVLYTPNALRNGIQGPAVSPSNRVTVGSVAGQTIYQLDVNRGTFSELVDQPYGEADDEVFTQDGTLCWTSLLSGVVRSRSPTGTIKTIGENVPVSPNGIAVDSNGNVFYSQFPGGDGGIYKVDPKGVKPQQRVFTTSTPMNGFDFSATNEIYGPLPFTGQVVKINLATQTETVVASGFIDPEAVRFSADKSTLYVLDIGTSSVYTVNIRTGAKTLVVKVPGLVYLDNFRPYGNGLLISDTTSNSPVYYNFATKRQSYVTPPSVFNLPQGISFLNGKIYIADYTAHKVYDTNTGKLTTIARSGPQPATAGVSAVSVSYGLYNVFASTKYLALSCFYDGKVQIRDIKTSAVVVDKINATFPYGVAITNDQKTVVIADTFVGLTVNYGTDFQTQRVISVGDNLLVGLALSNLHTNIAYVTSSSGTLYAVNIVSGTVRTVATGFNDPEGIAVFTEGRTETIVVANVGTKSLLKVDSNSGAKRVVATNLPIGLAGPDTLPAANTFTGVAIDNDGDVYITSDLKDALIKVGCANL